jgi:hypothetical protein
MSSIRHKNKSRTNRIHGNLTLVHEALAKLTHVTGTELNYSSLFPVWWYQRLSVLPPNDPRHVASAWPPSGLKNICIATVTIIFFDMFFNIILDQMSFHIHYYISWYIFENLLKTRCHVLCWLLLLKRWEYRFFVHHLQKRDFYCATIRFFYRFLHFFTKA